MLQQLGILREYCNTDESLYMKSSFALSQLANKAWVERNIII